jgi:hypothetical protein
MASVVLGRRPPSNGMAGEWAGGSHTGPGFTLNPDGTAMRTAKGSTAVTSGAWRVNDKG